MTSIITGNSECFDYKVKFFFLKVFEGNSDGDTVVSHWLLQPARACYCRLQPKTWNEQIALRLELYGKLVASGNRL